ncbi:MAG: zinc transporter ZupT [Lentisphaeria bacterium]|nr:zinc transporter ZupT [Lentisphaeria bacterium]
MTDFPSSGQLLFSLLLTLGAGLATGVGSCIAFFFKRSNRKFLSFALGFSGGVMIYISLAKLLPDAGSGLGVLWGDRPGTLAALTAFLGGVLLASGIDKLIPAYENPHEVRAVEEMDSPRHRDKLLRSGMLFALAIAVHNFPEGMAVFISGIADPATGISIAVAIAIHNIPEGITVSVPIYHATGSRKKAFLYSFGSGLAEPCGALAAWFIFGPRLSPVLLSALFAAVAGIMVYISFDELLPLAEEYGEHHWAVCGSIVGMFVIAISLIL